LDTLQINTGEKRIAINGDESRVIVFNPSDIIFAEKFYNLVGDFELKLGEYQKRGALLDANQETDSNGTPKNLDERLALLREICEYVRERIDHLFGKGTSQKAFGDTLSLDVFKQFFEGITPFVQTVRSEKIAQYTTLTAIKKRGRKAK
jgi:hypothetical protein